MMLIKSFFRSPVWIIDYDSIDILPIYELIKNTYKIYTEKNEHKKKYNSVVKNDTPKIELDIIFSTICGYLFAF